MSPIYLKHPQALTRKPESLRPLSITSRAIMLAALKSPPRIFRLLEGKLVLAVGDAATAAEAFKGGPYYSTL